VQGLAKAAAAQPDILPRNTQYSMSKLKQHNYNRQSTIFQTQHQLPAAGTTTAATMLSCEGKPFWATHQHT
jgi:hypothetical protein